MKGNLESDAKIGAGHASAMLRLGLREIRQPWYGESNIAQGPTEYGIFGTRTPGEVAEGRRADALEMDEERPSILNDRLQAAERGRDGRERETRDLDRE